MYIGTKHSLSYHATNQQPAGIVGRLCAVIPGRANIPRHTPTEDSSNMRTAALLLLAVSAALACEDKRSRRTKREELLVRAKRRWVLSTIEITEEDKGPFPKEISQMYNDKKDTVASHLFEISGAGVTEPPLGVFYINETTGKVYARRAVDRETDKCFHIKFDIKDKSTREHIDKELSFDVEVKDINDNAPTFHRTRIVENIPENSPEGILPVRLNSFDPDQEDTINSTMTISMVSQNPTDPKFEVEKIDNRTAQLKYRGCFDYDKVKIYNIIVKVADHGKPPLSSTALIILNITDTNTHLPTFKKNLYFAEVNEMELRDEFLKIQVEDKDTRHTAGWKAEYFFVSGNEGGIYAIKTDPKTNEGVLSIVKLNDVVRTTNSSVIIRVENEEKLFHCKHKPDPAPKPNTVTVTIKTIDLNDAPTFEKAITHVYQKEEEPPGRVLFTPKVTDIESDEIRFVKLYDPADWVHIDPKTGAVSTLKKMDRESPFVVDNVYKVVIGAIDNGDPPATGNGTVFIHLKDINDYAPMLLNKSVTLCYDIGNTVPVRVQDLDADPYSGPFAFSLDTKDTELKDYWKLDPNFGEEGGLTMVSKLASGNYSVPLEIMDQQNKINRETLTVVVCECGGTGACLIQPLTVNIGGAAIGLIIASLLLFLLLLLIFVCHCGKNFHPIPDSTIDEGHQTLIMYNQEGGSSECKAEPAMFLTTTTTTTRNNTATDGRKMAPPMTLTKEEIEIYNKSNYEEGYSTFDYRSGSRRGNGMYNQDTWTNKMGMYLGSSQHSRYSLQVNQHISDHLHRKLQVLTGGQAEEVDYHPHEYAYEGEGSISRDLDQLSLANLDLEFLNHLGPKFKTLGGICQESIKEKNIQF
uniref:Cadherin domain-containing protein n=1 Tax=Neogobius melanostomus TaxID=47308 RepID=A0A8C6UR63_9GOBI